MVASLYCLVVGWKAMGPGAPLYFIPWAKPVSLTLMAVAVCLFIAANAPTDIKRYLRHPQLTSVVLWAIAHLLANGDMRSLILFGGLGLWALIEMPLINRGAGAWNKPAAFRATTTGVPNAIGLAVFAGLIFAHPWLSGGALF
ncbi:MAG: putative membrane protein [Bacteroidia bacterium]|jgi:uncharacterized membrane protein